jgi:pimeloyl-ACP methyl ester carboxylesterase
VRTSALLVVMVHLLLSPAHAQATGAGHWEGSIQVAGIGLAIRVDLSVAGDSARGTIDIPQQNATGLSLRGVRMTADSLVFELPAGPGLARFEGTVAGDSAWGLFRQAGMTGTFHLRRGLAERTKQGPPPPYASAEVSFRCGDAPLAGTLTFPPSGAPHPAVILLTGSGAQTRDEDVFGFKVFAALADTLTRSGIAVLRFDDPGTGGSGGTPATTQAYGEVARAAFEFLRKYPGIDPSRIGMLGHSEGAIAAALAASRDSAIAFLVLMAGPALPGDSIILGQIEALSRSAGMPPEEISEQLALQRRVYEVIRADAGWDSVRTLLLRQAARGLPDSLARMHVESQLRTARSPWFRSFIDLDPAVALRSLSVPVLALLGEKDMQVPAATNWPVFERLKERGKNLTIVVVPGANHLFQQASTGHPGEYATLKKEFSGEFLRALIPWVATQAGLRK